MFVKRIYFSFLIVLLLCAQTIVNNRINGPTYYNVVTQFGADPTGVNDSQCAFNSAASQLTPYSALYVPGGTYILNLNGTIASCGGTGEIVLTTNNVKIFSDENATIEQMKFGLSTIQLRGNYQKVEGLHFLNTITKIPVTGSLYEGEPPRDRAAGVYISGTSQNNNPSYNTVINCDFNNLVVAGTIRTLIENPSTSVFTGSISGNVLTVSSLTSGAISIGQVLSDSTGDIAFGTIITGNGQAVGQWIVNLSQTVSSETVIGGAQSRQNAFINNRFHNLDQGVLLTQQDQFLFKGNQGENTIETQGVDPHMLYASTAFINILPITANLPNTNLSIVDNQDSNNPYGSTFKVKYTIGVLISSNTSDFTSRGYDVSYNSGQVNVISNRITNMVSPFNITVNTSAQTTSGNVLLFSNTSNLQFGQTVTGTNIQISTTVLSVTPTSVTLSQSVSGTISSGEAITFSAIDTLTAAISFDGVNGGNIADNYIYLNDSVNTTYGIRISYDTDNSNTLSLNITTKNNILSIGYDTNAGSIYALLVDEATNVSLSGDTLIYRNANKFPVYMGHGSNIVLNSPYIYMFSPGGSSGTRIGQNFNGTLNTWIIDEQRLNFIYNNSSISNIGSTLYQPIIINDNPRIVSTLPACINTSTFTGSVSGTSLTTSVGTPIIGQILGGSEVVAGTVITSGSGTSWTLSQNNGTISSEAMTGNSAVSLGNKSFVTDALSPTFLGLLTGSSTTSTPVTCANPWIAG